MPNCHNHNRCIKDVIAKSHEICAQNKLKMTDLRQKILEIIFQNHNAIKAYDVLQKLREYGISDKPPTIYRALDFFMKNHIIHKIHSINSYVVCSHLGRHNDCHFLICEKCAKVQECCDERLSLALKNIVKNSDFKIANNNVELVGLCKSCA